MERAKIISTLIEEKGLSRRQFAESIGLPPTTLQSIIKRGVGKASIDNIIKVCKGLGITVDELEQMASNGVLAIGTDEIINKEEIRIPIYGDISAGVLTPVNGVLEKDMKYITLPKSSLGKYSASTNLFAMKANGDSMNKVIKNGSIVIAKPVDPTELIDEDIVIYSHDGQYSIKRFRRIEDERILIFSPESTNKKFRDVVVPYDTQNDLIIHGKVIWYSITLN